MPPARISLILSRHPSLSFIAFGRSSGLHLVSSYSCCMYVRAGRPAFAWPYAEVRRSTSLMSSSLLLQQCPACLFRLTCIVFVMGGKWPYSCCLVNKSWRQHPTRQYAHTYVYPDVIRRRLRKRKCYRRLMVGRLKVKIKVSRMAKWADMNIYITCWGVTLTGRQGRQQYPFSGKEQTQR